MNIVHFFFSCWHTTKFA